MSNYGRQHEQNQEDYAIEDVNEDKKISKHKMKMRVKRNDNIDQVHIPDRFPDYFTEDNSEDENEDCNGDEEDTSDYTDLILPMCKRGETFCMQTGQCTSGKCTGAPTATGHQIRYYFKDLNHMFVILC